MGKGSRKAVNFNVNGVVLSSLKNLIDYLKEHPLLQHCTEEHLGGSPGTGRLIWARNPGSVFWPALIASFEDKEPEDRHPDDIVPPSEYRCVTFLETAFRISALAWKDIILVNEEKIDEQRVLVTHLNRFVIRKTWREDKSYKDAVSLLKEFIPLDIGIRQSYAFDLSIKQKQEKQASKPVKIKKSLPKTSSKNSSEKSFTDVSDRDNSSTGFSNIFEFQEGITTFSLESVYGKHESSSSVTSDKSDSETLSDISRKAKQRPKTGGAPMKEYVETRFTYTDKNFKFNPSTNWICTTCQEDIEPGTQMMCHDFPYHSYCLIPVTVTLKDGTVQKTRKCKCCAEQACSICKEETTDTENMATKCSKCELRFHRSCLLAWPQAVVQGSSGPITCPAHFCHTCVGEHYVLRKVRNFKVFSGSRYRCLYCPSTYHKPNCLPAGCGENITGKDFIVCPRHTLSDMKVSQRRFGCLTCGKNLKTSNPRRVECSMCLQIFHPECVGYSDAQSDGGVSVQAFGAGYKCSSCFWGLFPLYGQVIWYQQYGSPFWPARILYPRESTGRYEFCKNRIAGQYSIKYFGTLQSYYDRCSRTFPLSLATVKLFTTVKVYQEENILIKSAYDEAGFFSLLVDDHRDRLLPLPEPFYKKIERNIYRYSIGGTNKKNLQDEDAQGECYCAEEEDAEFCCTPNSGCHNRDTAVECNDNNCKGGSRCQNRMFSQKKKDSENTEQFLTVGKGWAVRAAQDFKEGDFIVEYCGEIVNNAEMQYRANRKTEEDPLYILEIDKHTFIDAEFCGNVSRLINHSCEPNCRIEKYTSAEGKPVVGVFAHQDIQQGDELTFDYAYGNKSSAPFRCHCGTSSCRGFIGKEASPSIPEVEFDIVSAELEKYDKECAKCLFGGHVLCCDYEDCYKVYHKSCAGLTKEPENEWFCPDHKVLPKSGKKRKSTNSAPPAKKKIALVPRRKSENKKSTISPSKLPITKRKYTKSLVIEEDPISVPTLPKVDTNPTNFLPLSSKTNIELETTLKPSRVYCQHNSLFKCFEARCAERSFCRRPRSKEGF